MKFFTLVAATALFATASAHGGVDTYTIGSTIYQGWSPYNSNSGQKSIQRQYTTYDPLMVADLRTAKIRCNNNGALGTGLTVSIAAGETIKAHWKQWTHRPAAIMVYMAKCPASGCDKWDGAGKVWFKIYHEGLVSGTQNKGKWAGDAIVDKLIWTNTIPASLAPGEYLIRHELLALHQANNPQFYPKCAQLTVTGSGTTSPPANLLVAFPGAYSARDSGIAFNIDSKNAIAATEYVIPRPAVWDGGAGAPKPKPEATTMVTSRVAAARAAATQEACYLPKGYRCEGPGVGECTCEPGTSCAPYFFGALFCF